MQEDMNRRNSLMQEQNDLLRQVLSLSLPSTSRS